LDKKDAFHQNLFFWSASPFSAYFAAFEGKIKKGFLNGTVKIQLWQEQQRNSKTAKTNGEGFKAHGSQAE
jgi:hypothetical protein